MKKNKKNLLTLILLLVGLVLIMLGIFISISYGTKDISMNVILEGIFAGESRDLEQLIIWDYRLPRTLAAVLVGCFLATSGAIMQGITKNTLASPSIMGVNQGAILAVAIYMTGVIVPGMMGRVAFAFIGASVSAILVFLLSIRKTNLDITRLLLAGSALGTLFLAVASMIALLTNNNRNLAFWMAGGFGGATWESVQILSWVLIVLVFVLILSPKITIVSLGDEVAIGLGEKPNLIRLLGLSCVVVLSGIATAIGGNIGFVCLIVPHIARMCIGTDYRYVIPVSMVFGGVLLVFSDIIARMLTSPNEVPVGAITSLIGVPVLIYLVRREKRA